MTPRRPTTLLVLALTLAATSAWGWRSSLFPTDWEPGHRDPEGRFLHDFSYAGYARGERALPALGSAPGVLIDATAPPFLADPSGTSDTTAAIQAAIDAAGASGGGVVLLPPGTYRVRPQTGDDKAALYLDRSGVTLRGAGPEATFIVNDEVAMRGRNVIRLAPAETRSVDFSWTWDQGLPSYPLLEDAAGMDDSVLVDGNELRPGDWVVVRADPTAEFIADHGMTGVWTSDGLLGLTFYRRVVAVGPEPGRLWLDIPLRYPLLRRDNARVTTTIPHIAEVGVENLAVGMRSITFGEMGDDDWAVEGTGAWEVHNSSLIEVNHVVDGWVRRVRSFKPEENWEYHILSNGLRLRFARSITVEEVDIRHSQYRGNGGNGVHFSVQGSDLLLDRCSASDSRHSFSIALIVATGNVLTRCRAERARHPVDFHMHLSPANLIDAMVLDDDAIEAARRTHADHGHGTTQSVIWNARGLTTGWEVDIGLKKLVETGQFGWGYVIGTSGPDHRVAVDRSPSTAPTDFVEGVGQGETLEPQSLYEAQRERRLGPVPVRRPSGRAGP